MKDNKSDAKADFSVQNLTLLFSKFSETCFHYEVLLFKIFIPGSTLHSECFCVCKRMPDSKASGHLRSFSVESSAVGAALSSSFPASMMPFLHLPARINAAPQKNFAALFYLPFKNSEVIPAAQFLCWVCRLGIVYKATLRVWCRATDLSLLTVKDTSRQRVSGPCQGAWGNASIFKQQNQCHHDLAVGS